MDKSKPNQNKDQKDQKDPKVAVKPVAPAAPIKVAPMFRPIDWLTLAITFGVIWIVYLFTLAPEQTLEDSGELCTGAYYAGIPHPPGYPFWAVYAWFWTAILPIGNVAWRVEVGESFAAAMGCGLLALMVSRGSSMLIEGIETIKNVPRQWENAICSVSGFVAGTLLGLDIFMWSEAVVINRISLFGVPWLIAVLACLMRWMYAPNQRRYLYLGMFLYGLCVTIHQTLLLGAMGVEVAIALAAPRLGRDIFLVNSAIYLVCLMLKSSVPALSGMSSIENTLFHIVGIGSIIAGGWLATEVKGFLSEWKAIIFMGLAWFVGVCVYFYEPVSCMTDPPMQWGYPRTVEGFFHALSRGQYEGISSYNIFAHPAHFAFQLSYIGHGLVNSFGWVYVFIGLLPFAYLFRLHKRERSWIIGLVAIYFCLSVLLVILINVSPDRASQDLNEVFFTASQALFAMMIGYGLTLLAAYTATHYEKIRMWGFAFGAAAAVLAIYSLKEAAGTVYRGPAGEVSLSELPHHIGLAFDADQYGLPIFANLILLAIPLCLIGAFLVYRQRGPVLIMLCLFTIMPLWSGLSHWYKSEQHNHWFGFWFGHDMFTPPFTDPKTGKLTYDNDLRAQLLKDPANKDKVYPEMDRNTIIYGGTDPGRFCPTYSIFCDSFIPHSCQPVQDQKFDRRDCYLITQNALADGTYLEYLRAQYNRSQQIDPPFFSRLVRYTAGVLHIGPTGSVVLDGPDMGKGDTGNPLVEGLANLAGFMLDRPFTAWGEHVEKYRRERGVYPPSEIYIASPADQQQCFQDYYEDLARRSQLGQLRQGESGPDESGHISISGQYEVMYINGLICKVIFDHNPTNSFYVEESMAIDWMYPHETPFGIIMKINRDPLPELSDDVFKIDHEFWTQYSSRLCGNLVTYNTSVQDIADFVERTYIRNNYKGYTGDHAFVRDDDAQKAFSKLRSSQAGVYAWRCGLPGSSPPCPPEYRQKTPESQAALIRETDFAFKQAFAFCPYNGEVVFRYINFLLGMAQTEAVTGQTDKASHHFDDAILVVETCQKLDPYNEQLSDIIKNVKEDKKQIMERIQAYSQIDTMEATARSNPGDVKNLVTLGSIYMQQQQTNRAAQLFDIAMARPELTADVKNVVMLGKGYMELQQTGRAVQLFDLALPNPALNFQDAQDMAMAFAQMQDMNKLDTVLRKMVSLEPDLPEARCDLAALECITGRQTAALADLKLALSLNTKRLAKNPAANDLLKVVATDPRFGALHNLPEFQSLIHPL